MALEGMDIEAVETIGRNLTKQGEAVQNVITAITGLVGHAEQNWKGPDANKFQSDWNSQHKPALVAAKTQIDQLGHTATTNATQQRQTSAN